jgi:hypothetical protein
MVGIPHGHSIAKICPPKLAKSRGIEEIPPRTSLTLERRNHKIKPLCSLIWEGNQKEKNHKGSSVDPSPNPTEKGLESATRKLPRNGSENHQKEKLERHIKAFRNHAESSIHTKQVHTKSSLSPDHPSLSQDLTMKLSS